MALIVRAPTGDGATAGTLTGTAGTRWQSLNDHPDWAGASVIDITSAVGGGAAFTFDNPGVPAGSTVTLVKVTMIARKTGIASAQLRGNLIVGGTNYAGGGVTPFNQAFFEGADQWNENPRTGLPWTVEDVNGTGPNPLQFFGFGSNDSLPATSFASIQLEIEYTPPPGLLDIQAPAGDSSTSLYISRGDLGAVSDAQSLQAVALLQRGGTGAVLEILDGSSHDGDVLFLPASGEPSGIFAESAGTIDLGGLGQAQVAIGGTSPYTLQFAGGAVASVRVNAVTVGALEVSGVALVANGLTAHLQGGVDLSGSATATSTVTVTSDDTLVVGGSSQAQVNTTAGSQGSVDLAGSIFVSMGNVPVEAGTAYTLDLGGQANTAVSVAAQSHGATVTAGSLEAAVLLQVTSSGSLSLSGASAALVGVAATSQGTVEISGGSEVTSSVAAQLTGTVDVAGSAYAAVANQSDIQAYSFGTIEVSGLSDVEVRLSAQSVQETSLSGSLGAAVSLQAQSSGSVDLAGSSYTVVVVQAASAAEITPLGGGLASVRVGIDSHATVYVSGSASASVDPVAVVSGAVEISGSAYASVSNAASVSGVHLFFGSSLASVGLSVSSYAEVEAQGQAYGLVGNLAFSSFELHPYGPIFAGVFDPTAPDYSKSVFARSETLYAFVRSSQASTVVRSRTFEAAVREADASLFLVSGVTIAR